jgi:Na+/melibiose symporter-like transporter
LIGFEPNVEQREATKLAIRTPFAGFPSVSSPIGVLLFLRFRLTEEEHRRIRAELDARSDGSGRGA